MVVSTFVNKNLNDNVYNLSSEDVVMNGEHAMGNWNLKGAFSVSFIGEVLTIRNKKSITVVDLETLQAIS
jgi:hypothetical protein